MRTWDPDTCGCRVEELYEYGLPVGMGAVVHKCAVHASVPDEELYDVILNGENKVKNAIQNFVASGGIAGLVGASISWSFAGTGANRVLSVWIINVVETEQQKADLQYWCDTQFGVGKVTVV